jgi:nitrogenase subunit NifH
MDYRGVSYDYGFDATVLLPSGEPRAIHIVMTHHEDNRPYKYTGICLENGFQVTNNKNDRSEASYDIIEEMVDAIVSFESARAKNKSLTLVDTIWKSEQAKRDEFCEKMKNAISVNEYRNIRNKILNNPEVTMPAGISYDCKDMYLLSKKVEEKKILSDLKYARI